MIDLKLVIPKIEQSPPQDEVELKLGSFYWVIPKSNSDYPLSSWENQRQPARFVGISEEGYFIWHCLSQGEPSDWPMLAIGPEILYYPISMK